MLPATALHAPSVLTPPPHATNPLRAVSRPASAPRGISLVQVTTLALWSSCAVGGVLGLSLSYRSPSLPTLAPEPVVVEKLQVDLAPPQTLPMTFAESAASEAPPPPGPVLLAPAPAPLAVAAPSASLAFAVPVEGPVRIVAAEQASGTRRTSPVTSSAVQGGGGPPVETLVFGQGQGRQPAPEYPLRAMNQGQEGAVTVRFTVQPNGRVSDALASTPCAWPLLNDSAVNTVRAFWRFPRGIVRVYEVTIRFRLPK